MKRDSIAVSEVQKVFDARDALRSRIASLFMRLGTGQARPLPTKTARITKHILETTYTPAPGASCAGEPRHNALPWKWLTKNASPN